MLDTGVQSANCGEAEREVREGAQDTHVRLGTKCPDGLATKAHF